MGWYTFVDGEMVFYKETWQHKEDVQERIDDNKKDIEDVKLEMAMLVAGRVEDLIQTKDCEDNDIDIPMTIRWKLEDLWERLENAQYENWKLEFLLENWDKRHGTFIDKSKEDGPAHQPPIEPDDSNPLVVITQEPVIAPNPHRLKLEFDDTSAKEIPIITTHSDHSVQKLHNLGSLNDLKL